MNDEGEAIGPDGRLFTTSPIIAELAAALAKAQAEYPAIKKERTAKIDSAKAAYSYAYADLSDILDAVRKPLSHNGLAILQPVCADGSGALYLVTLLVHSSGQWIQSQYPLAIYERPQEMGSAITYARRYAATSLLGIAAEEDDDGASAQASERKADPTKPRCPKCEKQTSVIKGKSEFGGGWLCFGKKGGCGAKWDDDAPGAPAKMLAEGFQAGSGGEPTKATCPHCKSTNLGTTHDGHAYCLDCKRGV